RTGVVRGARPAHLLERQANGSPAARRSPMTSRTAVFLLSAALLAAASPARSDSIRFCIRINAEYEDNARGEDQWTCDGDLRCRLGRGSGYPDPKTDPDDVVRFQTFRGGLVEIW